EATAMAQKAASSSNYMKRMAYLSGRIFVDFARPTSSQDRNVARRLMAEPWGRQRAGWYPPLDSFSSIFRSLRSMGVFRDEYRDFQEEMDRLRKLRGKDSKHTPYFNRQKKD
ncbi:hypothetical protein BOX15_Mlig000212g8, partial [Macrostomum lignano]